MRESHIQGLVSETSLTSINTSIIEDDQINMDEFYSVKLLNATPREVIELFSAFNTRELRELLEMSSSHPWTSELYTIQQILIEYLVQNSPEEALAAIAQMSGNRRQALLRDIFANWSQVDLNQALAAAAELSHTDQQIAIDTVLATSKDLSSEKWLSFTNGLNFLPHLEDWEQELRVYEILDQEPLRAIELLARDEIDDGRQIDLFRLVAEKMYQKDSVNSILQLQDARLGVGIFDELFEQITAHDREAAFAFFSTIEDRRREVLGWKLLQSWIVDDEEGAFQAINNLPKSGFRQSMWSDFAYIWGRKNPSAVLDRLMEIPRSVREDALSTAAGELAIDDPKDMLDRLSTLRAVPGANVGRATWSVIRTWSSAAPKQALDWVQSNTKKETSFRKELLREVLPKFALVEPEQAMTFAVDEHNPDDTYLSLQNYVLRSLLIRGEFDGAIELLDGVSQDIKFSLQREVGSELLRNNRLDDTLKLADSLTNEEKIDYFNSVASSGVIFGRTDDVLKMIARLATTDLRTGVVEQLLSKEYYLSKFTNDQLETLKSFVSK